MKAIIVVLIGLLIALLGIRARDTGLTFGDVVAFSVLAWTVGIEVLILVGGKMLFESDPYQQRLAEMRANLELVKQESARKRSGVQ